MPSPSSTVVVTGANGFVGAQVCAALARRATPVRAIVRRAGTAPALPGVEEVTGDFTDPAFAADTVSGATAVVTTVHPMGSSRAVQHAIGVQGTTTLARAAAAAGVDRLIHVSTAAVYDRSPQMGDVEESSPLVGDDANDYAVTKRDADQALAQVDGITRVLLRPPAILGPGPTSTWNTLRPAEMREDPRGRRAIPEATYAWVHVDDLSALIADLATGQVPDRDDPDHGPVPGGCTALNVAAPRATQRDYLTAVTEALGVEPEWRQAPAWTGSIVARRAHAWGWTPSVTLAQALAEVAAGLRAA